VGFELDTVFQVFLFGSILPNISFYVVVFNVPFL